MSRRQSPAVVAAELETLGSVALASAGIEAVPVGEVAL